MALAAEGQETVRQDHTFLQVKGFFDRSYGEDYNLRSGKQYAHYYAGVFGHQFFNSPTFRKGSVTIRGDRYDDVLLNYDIYNQLLVLKHTDNTGRTELLQLTAEFIEEFTLDGKEFVRMTFPQTGTEFFQVIRSGNLACLSHWEKDMVFSASATQNSYTFNKQLRRTYLLKDAQLRSFSTRASFVSLFRKEIRRAINRFVRNEAISFRQLSDEHLIMILEFCNSLDTGTDD